MLLILHLLVVSGHFFSDLFQDDYHGVRDMLLVLLGHCFGFFWVYFLGFVVWGFWDRAPRSRSWFLCSSLIKVAQLSSEPGLPGFWVLGSRGSRGLGFFVTVNGLVLVLQFRAGRGTSCSCP